MMLCADHGTCAKTFTFDATHRIDHRKGRTAPKAESGEMPFDDPTGFGLPSRTTFSVLILPAPLSSRSLHDELSVSIPEPTSVAWEICND